MFCLFFVSKRGFNFTKYASCSTFLFFASKRFVSLGSRTGAGEVVAQRPLVAELADTRRRVGAVSAPRAQQVARGAAEAGVTVAVEGEWGRLGAVDAVEFAGGAHRERAPHAGRDREGSGVALA